MFIEQQEQPHPQTGKHLTNMDITENNSLEVFDISSFEDTNISEERLERLKEINRLYSQNAEVFSNLGKEEN